MHFKMQKKIKFRVLIYSKNIFNRVPDRFEKVTMESDEFNKNIMYMFKKVQMPMDKLKRDIFLIQSF